MAPRDIYVENAQQALEVCRSLLRKREASLFRGQTCDWPVLLPSLLRPNTDRANSEAKLRDFLEWATSVPQMAIYRESESALTAIAQHYGVPTRYLDLTTSPEVAILFAKQTGERASRNAQSVVYCFSETEFSYSRSVNIVRIDVANLWRLQAQQGLFLEFFDDDAKSVRGRALRIHFPPEQITAEETLQLYPARKSALESVIDQWMYRHGIESFTRSSGIPRIIYVKRYTYPGAFRWRKIPGFEPEWFGGERSWILPPIEAVSSLKKPTVQVIPRFDLSDPIRAREAVVDVIKDPILRHRALGQRLSFKIELSPEKEKLASSVSEVINRCWDGLRVLPYPSSEIISSIALTTAFLSARAENIKDVDKWPVKLWQDVEIIETAPVGGHIAAGLVSKSDLASALSSRYAGRLTKSMRRLWAENPALVMNYIVDPWILFDFQLLKKMFVEQFVPTTVDSFWEEDLGLYEGSLGCMWSLSFNPALLGFVTKGDYRFGSPMAFESDIEKMIFITPQMDKDDIEEVFTSCLPSILAHSKPFQVKFTNYSHDSRPIWQIDRVVEQATCIVDIAGISVLEVFTSLEGEGNDPPAILNRGLGAFEVWLIARKQIEAMQGTPIESHQALLQEFLSALAASNRELETRARGMPDWPGSDAPGEDPTAT